MKTLLAVALVTLAVVNWPAHAETNAERTEKIQRGEIIQELVKKGQFAAAKALTDGATEPVVVEAPRVPVETRVVNNASEWAKLGTNLGQAMVATAKEAGMAVAQFADTPLGRITTVIIAYKVVGSEIIRTGLAFFVFFAGIFSLAYLYKYLAYDTVEYEYVPLFWGAFTRRRVKSIVMTKVDSRNEIPAGVGVWLALVASFIIICMATGLMMPK